MFNLIPISLLIMSLGGIVYITSNHLSEFDNDEEKNSGFTLNLKARFVDYINQLPLDNVKNQSLSLTQKFLHRIRLALLKADNRLTKLISKLSERDKLINGNGNGNGNLPDFWDNLSKNKPDNKTIKPEIPEKNGGNIDQGVEIKIELASENNKKVEKFFDIKTDNLPALSGRQAGDGHGKTLSAGRRSKKSVK